MFGTRNVKKGWCRAMVGLCLIAFILTVVVAGVAVSISPLHDRPLHVKSSTSATEPDTIVFFFSTSCRFCVDMKAILRKAIRIVGHGQMRFIKVNVDNDQTLAEKYTISGVPTLVRVSGKTGKVMGRMQGGGKSLNTVVDFMYGSD
jgi:thiol-disulfide isomerase/thioredoxin